MKKILSLMMGIAAMFASCSQSEELTAENNSAKEVTFSLTADNGVQTRAAGTLRYVMAIYDESGQTEVLPATEFSSSTFAVRLDPGKYTCLFWADYGSTNYNATNLKSVALQDAAPEVEAFYAKQGITVTDGGTINVTLSRAVAKVTLNETDRLVAGSIKVTYDGFKGFDVSSGNGINSATLTQTLPIATTITGTVANPTKVGEFLLLTNADERVLSDFRVQYNSEAEKTISNVPVQANYVTNINGKFSVNVNQPFNISINDVWATTDKEIDFPPYITFSAASQQTFGMKFDAYSVNGTFALGLGEYFEYSVGDGNWQRFTNSVSGIAFGGTLGDLRLRGKSSQGTTSLVPYCYSSISFGNSNIPVSCKGDIRTLVDYENFNTANTSNARFHFLFYSCASLTTPPELPAMNLASQCYKGIFYGCTSLTTAPELPATTLAEGCYQGMFYNCASLTTAPKLPATTLADHCYRQMFYGCTSLTTAPELTAETLAEGCYFMMFSSCTKLSKVKMLATDVTADGCFDDWLFNAGTEASSRTLILYNSSVYDELINRAYLFDNWRDGQATIQYTNP